MIPILFTLSALLYLSASFWLSRGLENLRSPQVKSKPTLTFDIIIAARNEEKSLPILFKSLNQLEYPTELYTITVVNDRSTDGTAAVLKKLQADTPNLSVLTIKETPEGIAPKKFAISEAIKSTHNHIILSTDADSVVQPQWLQTIASYFLGNEKLGLLQGITKYEKQNNISKPLMNFQRVDFASHCIIAAAGIGRNLPINSNANNFAYRRTTFESIAGFEEKNQIVSGDDDLLVQKIWKSSLWDLSFMIEDKASVITDAMPTWIGMFNQRVRWGSKTVHYETGQKLVLGSIFLFYLITLFSIPMAIAGILNWSSVLGLFLAKLLGELFFMIPGTKTIKEQELLIHSFWASPLQLFLVVFSVFTGVFGSFTWKSQKFKREVK